MRKQLLVAALLAGGSLQASAATDTVREATDFRLVQFMCRSEKAADTQWCAAFIMGFLTAKEFEEHLFQKEPVCLQRANLTDIAKQIFEKLRVSKIDDNWTGLYLTRMVLETSGCSYRKDPAPK